jgi:tRNA G18 (ribose-2'-O)-methylase SpoU
VAATVISDPADPRVADFRRLNDTAHRRQVESAGPFGKGVFVVEGWLAVERLVPSRYPVRAVLVDAAKLERAEEVIGRRHGPLFAAHQDVLDAIVGFPLHRGIVAVAERGRPQLWTDVAARGRRLVVTEGVNDAENLGSIIRNAVALGGDGLLLDPTSCDPLTRRTVRVSVGHALTLPFARMSWPDGLASLHESGVTTVALTPRADAVAIDEVDLAPDQRVAIVVGAEGAGLTDAAIDACDLAVRIPMARGVDSLNVAAATAIAAHRLFGAL